MNRILIGLVGMVMISMASLALAGGAKKGAAGGVPRAFQPLHQVLEKLNLSDSQVAQVSAILDKAEAKVAELRREAKSSGDKTGILGKAKTLRGQTMVQIAGVLTPAQRATFRQEVQRLRQERAGLKSPATQPAGPVN